MRFEITSRDPFGVLASTKPIVENLKYVEIHEKNLDKIIPLISEKLKTAQIAQAMDFGDAGSLENNVQLIFLEDVCNFCFWGEKEGKPRWEVKWPERSKSVNGWYAFTKCFQRAIEQNRPILQAEYLAGLSLDEAQSLFLSSSGVKIPLLKQRMKNLNEAGRVLQEKYNGEFINVLKKAKYDAINLVKLLIKDFPSFRDIVELDSREIYFLKRAQICALDISYLKDIKIKNIDALSAFADYKIPQILRKFGITSYEKELANKIDNYILIPAGSREEIEIRSSTVWCIELIKQKLKKYTSADIDNALWLASQDQSDIKPYHCTYTTYY